MGVYLSAKLVDNNPFFGLNKWVPQTIRGGGWPALAAGTNLDALNLAVNANAPQSILLEARGFLPGTSINANSIEVLVQPLPVGTYMSFTIAPTVTINSPNYVSIVFDMGNKGGEVVGALHSATVTASDNQGTSGSFTFY